MSSTSLWSLLFLLFSFFFTFPSSLFLPLPVISPPPSLKLYHFSRWLPASWLSAFEDGASVGETGQAVMCSHSKLNVTGAKKQRFSCLSWPHKWSLQDQGHEKVLAPSVLGCRLQHTAKAGSDLDWVWFLAHVTPCSNRYPQDLKFFSPCHLLFPVPALGGLGYSNSYPHGKWCWQKPNRCFLHRKQLTCGIRGGVQWGWVLTEVAESWLVVMLLIH